MEGRTYSETLSAKRHWIMFDTKKSLIQAGRKKHQDFKKSLLVDKNIEEMRLFID
jgi:hypothetical protein